MGDAQEHELLTKCRQQNLPAVWGHPARPESCPTNNPPASSPCISHAVTNGKDVRTTFVPHVAVSTLADNWRNVQLRWRWTRHEGTREHVPPRKPRSLHLSASRTTFRAGTDLPAVRTTLVVPRSRQKYVPTNIQHFSSPKLSVPKRKAKSPSTKPTADRKV